MPEPKRHHYIPIFYLKRWVGLDSRLCEFSRPHDKLKPLRKHPAATGYVDNLYTVDGMPDEHAQIMERLVLAKIDDSASKALHQLLNCNSIDELEIGARIGWARFLYSLTLRTPEQLEWARVKLKEMQPEIVEAERHVYLEKRRDGDPATFEEFKQLYLNDPRNADPKRHLHRFLGNGMAVHHIANMRWSVLNLQNNRHSLLTSDRPVIMTNGLGGMEGHLAMPISPKHIFLAANNSAIERNIHATPHHEIAERLNSRVVEQARRYVYAQDDRQLRFVLNRFGKMLQATPLG